MQLRLMAVSEYAKLRSRSPQLIHYYIRTGKLGTAMCDCGRKCVVVEAADQFFKDREKKDES